jgi:hypothetical protein
MEPMAGIDPPTTPSVKVLSSNSAYIWHISCPDASRSSTAKLCSVNVWSLKKTLKVFHMPALVERLLVPTSE